MARVDGAMDVMLTSLGGCGYSHFCSDMVRPGIPILFSFRRRIPGELVLGLLVYAMLQC